MSKTHRHAKTEDRRSSRALRARTTTADLIERADDLLAHDYLAAADSRLLGRTLRLIEGRTGIAPSDFAEGMAA